MAKTPDELFELIKKMTVSEKGYFKKSFSGQADTKNNYIKLFDVYDGLEVYDDAGIKEKLKIIIKTK